MNIQMIRYSETKQFNGSTFGLWFIDRTFYGYCLEDEKRDVKVMGETRIPEGNYILSIADWGQLNDVYRKRWPNDHIGMLMLNNVRDFSGILIHCARTEKDTAGCLTVGDSANNNQVSSAILGDSWDSYLRFYRRVAPAVASGSKEYVRIRELNLDFAA